MNKFNTKSAQGGFTLIELIVVIVILGILAATALPKFASLGGDARIATLQAAKGSINSASAVYHGKWMIKPTDTSFTVEGKTVNITNGYPTADTAFAEAAGLSTDDFSIAAAGGVLTISPKNIASGVDATCKLTYTSAAAGAAPTVSLLASKCD